METSIRFIRVSGGIKTMKPALCFRGRRQAYAVINDENGIRVVSNIPLKSVDAAPIVIGPLGVGHQEYPVDLFVKRFIDIGARKGITERAKFMLQRVLEGGITDDTVLPPDTQEPGSIPDSPKPDKPASESPRKPAAVSGGPARTAGAELIRRIAAELKLEPTKLRKLLRSKGLSAPYENESLIRSKLG